MSDQSTALTSGQQNGLEPPAQKPSGLISYDSSENAILMDTAKFEHCLRLAKLFSQSRLVPEHYRGNLEDCFIAIYQATRMRTDVMGYMQNTYVIGGKLAMEGKLAIALINSRGPFSGPLQWEEGGEGMEKYAVAYATHEETGEVLRSIRITMKMAEAEKWTKNSKWTSMPDQMLRYRSAAFFGRAYCPDILMGMLTKDEAEDLVASGQISEGDESRRRADDLTARVLAAEAAILDAPRQLSAAQAPEVTVQGAAVDKPQAVPVAAQQRPAAGDQSKALFGGPTQQQAPSVDESEQQADDVGDTISKMEIEVEQCAECQTKDDALKCVAGVRKKYGELIAGWSENDVKRFGEAYEKAFAVVRKAFASEQAAEPAPAATENTPAVPQADERRTDEPPKQPPGSEIGGKPTLF